MAAEHRLSSLAVGAGFWSFASYGGDQLFAFLIFAVLARTLDPTSFGIFIIGLAVAEMSRIVAQAGLSSTLSRVPKVTPQITDTIFWSNIVLACIVTSACFLLRHPIATLMGSPDSAPVIGALVFTVPIIAAGSVHRTLNLLSFGHRALAVRTLVAGLVGGFFALLAAYAGWGVWALVVHRFCLEIITTLVSWWAYRWKPGLAFSWVTLKSVIGLASSIALSQMLLTLLVRIQEAIISRMVGVSALGMMRISSKLSDVVGQAFITSYFTVGTPTLSRFKNDPERMQNGFIRILSTCSLILMPLIGGIGATLHLLIPLLFGEQWSDGIGVARVLCLASIPYVLGYFFEPVYLVMGKARLISQVMAINLVLTLMLLPLGALFGLIGFAWALTIKNFMMLLVHGLCLRRVLRTPPHVLIKFLLPAAFATSIMVLAIGLTAPVMASYMNNTNIDRVEQTAFYGLVGSVVYFLSLCVFLGRSGVNDLRALIVR